MERFIMSVLITQFKKGVFGGGWKNAGIDFILIIGVLAASKVYAILNHGPSVLFLRTPVDQWIPLVKPFVIPYISLDLFVFLTLLIFLLFRNKVFQSAAVSMLAAWAVSFLFYLFQQSFVQRPVIMGNDLFSMLIREIYANDKPYNDFPSLHTSLSVILGIHWWHMDRRIGLPAAGWVLLIVLSTVFIKQHYVADVIGGLLLAFGVSILSIRLLVKNRENKGEI